MRRLVCGISSVGKMIANVNILSDGIASLSARNVAFLGDSITEESEEDAPSLNYRNRGYAIWSMYHTSHRFNISGIFGYSGKATSFIAAQVANVTATNADICFILSGANDILGSATIQQITDNYDLIATNLKAEGILPVFLSVFPRNDGDTTQNERSFEMSNYLKRKSSLGEIAFIDAAKIMIETEATINTAFSYDGVHTNMLGAYALGKLVGAWLDDNFPNSVNPVQLGTKNYVPNHLFVGTGGTAISPATGEVPDGWTLNTSNVGETVASTIETVSPVTSERAIVLNVTGDTTATARPQMQNRIDDLPAGNYYAYAEIEKTGDIEVFGVGASLRSFSPPTFSIGSMNSIDSTIPIPENVFSFGVRTKVVAIEANQTTFFYLGGSVGAGSGILKYKNFALVKVS